MISSSLPRTIIWVLFVLALMLTTEKRLSHVESVKLDNVSDESLEDDEDPLDDDEDGSLSDELEHQLDEDPLDDDEDDPLDEEESSSFR